MKTLRKLITIGLIFSSSLIFAQMNKIHFGMEAGPSLKTLYGFDTVDENELSIGFSAGLAFQYNFTDLLSLRTNISFERKGWTTKGEATDEMGNPIGEMTFHTNFDYLTLPLLVRLTFGNKIRYFVNAGPYIGYLLKVTDVAETLGDYPRSEYDNTANFKQHDFGLTTGLGMTYQLAEKLLLSAEIRNNLGLVNISALPVRNDKSIKTNSTNFLIGIAYGIGRRYE